MLRAIAVTGAAAGLEIQAVKKEGPMFLILFLVLLVVWFTAWIMFHVAGALIHLLFIVAVISLVLHFVRRKAPNS